MVNNSINDSGEIGRRNRFANKLSALVETSDVESP